MMSVRQRCLIQLNKILNPLSKLISGQKLTQHGKQRNKSRNFPLYRAEYLIAIDTACIKGR
jgi:hypothetical protein